MAQRTALVSLSTAGALVATRLAEHLQDADVFVHTSASCQGAVTRFERLVNLTADLFQRYRRLVFVAPCGAVVRAVAPLARHKTTDPAVVVLDVGARHAISLLSGHEGGANALAFEIAGAIGAEPVVTTTTDALKDIIVGVGCRRGASARSIVAAIRSALTEAEVSLDRVRLLASVDLKRNERGLHEAAELLGLLLRFVARREILATRRTFQHSLFVQKKVGLPAVAEPTALLAGRRTRLLLPRRAYAGVTVALAREDLPWSESDREVLSTAPAAPSEPSPRAPSSSATRPTCTSLPTSSKARRSSPPE